MLEPSETLLFSSPGMATIFSPQAHVRAMLAFEAALAGAEARAGIIPPEAATAVAGLEVDATRMRANLDMTGGLIMAESLTMALALHMGRPEAQHLVKKLCDQAARSGSSLRQIAQADEQVCAQLSSEEIERALDPSRYLGSTNTFIDRALASYREVRSLRGGG
jgi:3-carboxy-cis,cis-muconate cycloisomerase